MKEGFAIHIYTLNEAMKDTCMANADGDMLIVPQQGLPSAVAPRVRACLHVAVVHCMHKPCVHPASHPERWSQHLARNQLCSDVYCYHSSAYQWLLVLPPDCTSYDCNGSVIQSVSQPVRQPDSLSVSLSVIQAFWHPVSRSANIPSAGGQLLTRGAPQVGCTSRRSLGGW
jgi:homogentisate 1,2-dioxygenase